jgi:hypothetical protein
MAENEAKLREAFKLNFKRVENVNRDELITTIKDEILPMFYGPKIPCTLIVLDEVQQFIGQDGNKTIDIQNLAQDISSNFGGKFFWFVQARMHSPKLRSFRPCRTGFQLKLCFLIRMSKPSPARQYSKRKLQFWQN